MKQIVIAIKKGKHFDLPHIFWQQTRTLLPLAKRDCVTKNYETQVIPRKKIPFWKRNSRGTFCNYKRETCKQSRSLVSLTYPLKRPWKRNTKKIFSTRDYEVVGPKKLWFSINACLHIYAVKKAYFKTVSFWNRIMNSLIASWEKWNCGGKSSKS